MFSAALYARVHCYVHNRTRDRGCSAHPAFPAPSDFRGREGRPAKLGRNVPRECERLHVILRCGLERTCDRRDPEVRMGHAARPTHPVRDSQTSAPPDGYGFERKDDAVRWIAATSLAMTGQTWPPLICRSVRIAYQRHEPIDAVHEFAVGHGDEQREHHAEMQRRSAVPSRRCRATTIVPRRLNWSGTAWR